MYQLLKLVMGVVALVLLSPIILCGMLVAPFSTGRPVFYVHVRSGKDKKPFQVYNLSPIKDDLMSALTGAQRVTGSGLPLRKFLIDALPWLFNVLKGDISLIGPRPLLVEYDIKYSAAQRRQFEVCLGLTGSAQVRVRNSINWGEKLNHDVACVAKMRFFLYLSILIQTPGIALRSAGFQHPGESTKIRRTAIRQS